MKFLFTFVMQITLQPSIWQAERESIDLHLAEKKSQRSCSPVNRLIWACERPHNSHITVTECRLSAADTLRFIRRFDDISLRWPLSLSSGHKHFCSDEICILAILGSPEQQNTNTYTFMFMEEWRLIRECPWMWVVGACEKSILSLDGFVYAFVSMFFSIPFGYPVSAYLDSMTHINTNEIHGMTENTTVFITEYCVMRHDNFFW